MTNSSLNAGTWEAITTSADAYPAGGRPVIAGKKAVDRTVASGLFICPHEGVERAYWKHRVRSWVAVFSVPILPRQVIGEYVECFCCGGMSDPAIVATQHPALGNLRPEA